MFAGLAVAELFILRVCNLIKRSIKVIFYSQNQKNYRSNFGREVVSKMTADGKYDIIVVFC